MIVDFRDPQVAPPDVDVCIVGSGPAGLAIAEQFVGTGTSVLMVESGGVGRDADGDELNRGRVVGLGVGLEEGRARAFGGTATVWPGQCIRLDSWDFESREWVPDSGWPFPARVLDPFYERAEAWLGIPPSASDEAAWRRFGLTEPAFDGELLAHKSAVYSPRPDVGAARRTVIEQASEVTVLLHATVTGIRAKGGDGQELDVRSRTGRAGQIRARRTVLCAGGIENARLLLVSELGNPDVVGRYFHEHPTIWVDVHSDRPASLQEFYDYLGRGRIRYVPKLRLGWGAQQEHRVLGAAATVVYDRVEPAGWIAARKLSSALQSRRLPRDLAMAELRGVVGALEQVARAGWRRFRRGRPTASVVRGIRLKILLEQAPNPDSRVFLSDRRDALDVPEVAVDWRLTELERRTGQVMLKVVDGEFRRLGLGRLVATDQLDGEDWTTAIEDAFHPMGATRMSADPARGVVDPDCRVHGIEGLYVCGSSVFPTGGYANPTVTIVALALRLADHLRNSPASARR